VQNAGKDRLASRGLVLAVLPLVICSVAGAYVTLEALLNLLWVLLAFGVFAKWIASGYGGHRLYSPRLVSLVFVLSLLFPVISANDDEMQMDLINDAQTSRCIITSLKIDKQLPGSARLLSLPIVPAVKGYSFLPLTLESVFEPVHAACVAIPGDATGNHSPPFC